MKGLYVGYPAIDTARVPEVVAAEQPLTAILDWSATARR